MRLNANVLSVITLLLCLASPPGHADSLLATLNDWITGTSTGNQATNAGFKGGVTADAGKSFATTFDDSQTLDVLFDVRVAPEHIGKTGSLYLVARYNNDWFMKDSNGQWQSWDYQLTSLVSTAGPRPLQALESLKVAGQLKGLTGKIEVYAGYKVDGDIHYNAKPFSFSVQEKAKPAPVVPANGAPIADAGVDKDINEHTQITLDGSKSRDPDGSIVKYLWEQISGLPVYKVYDANTAKATITTPEVRTTEELQFKLTVTDNQGAIGNAVVSISVNPFTQKTTISGVAFDAPIIGGNVTVSSLSGTILGTATTDDNGKYSIELSETAISAGYRVEITGGQMNGQPFTGRMTAVYAATETRSNANLTPITTLIQEIAQDSAGVDALAKRNDALQTLVRLGLIPSADWNQLDSTWFDLLGLSGRIKDAGGIDAWIQLIKADLADGELSIVEAKSLFPKAHGGIEKISVASGTNIALFPSEYRLASITSEPAIDSTTLVLKLLDAPNWVWVEGDHLRIEPPLAIAVGDSNVTVEIATNALTTGRKLSFTVSVLQQVTLLSGSLGPAGGRLENQWRDIILEAPAGALTQTFNIQYVVGVSSDGSLQFKLHTTPEMPEDELFKLQVSKPSVEIILKNYLQSGISTRKKLARSSSSVSPPSSSHSDICNKVNMDDADGDKFQFDTILVKKTGFLKSYSIGTNNEPRFVPFRGNVVAESKSACTSILLSSQKNDEALENAGVKEEDIEPVLFVHGFALGGMGEVDDYFANFPGLVAQWSPDGKRRFKPYTFVWHTNARFEDIAYELGNAITNIPGNKKVHIMAHSYGGLLVRTLLQGFAEKVSPNRRSMVRAEYFSSAFMEKHIASVTTVGTPHSGIFSSGEAPVSFDEMAPIRFESGKDNIIGALINGCTAITCHEAGEYYQYNGSMYGTFEHHGQIVYRLAMSLQEQLINPNQPNLHKYPMIPSQILIGLVPENSRCLIDSDDTTCTMSNAWRRDNEGDGLISLAGQRLLPAYHQLDSNVPSPMLFKRHDIIDMEEHLLGFDAEHVFLGDQAFYDIYANRFQKYDTFKFDSKIAYVYPISTEYPLRTVAYNHRGGAYNFNDKIEVGYYRHRVRPILSEAALKNCKGNPNQVICQHATWGYFTKMVSAHPAQPIYPESNITVNAKIKSHFLKKRSSVLAKSATEFPAVIIYAGDEVVGEGFADSDGNFSQIVKFKPDTTYSIEVLPPSSSGSRATRRERSTVATVEESGTLDFGEIDLISQILEQSKIPVQLKDASTGALLFDYQLTLKNENGATLLTKTVNSAADAEISPLPVGIYSIETTKTGYTGTGKQECIATLGLLLEPEICVVTMVPQAYVVTGGLSAVLTWGQDPNDLDSHLLQYDAADNLLCHIFYGTKVCGNDSLDVDDTSSFGPETIKITALDATKHYVYAIHHYSGSGSITSTSQAQVKVTFADASTRTFTAPTAGGNGHGDYWRVFDIVNNKLLPCQQNCMQTAIAPRVRSFGPATEELPWKEDIARDLRPK